MSCGISLPLLMHVVTTVVVSLPTACTRNPSRKMFGCSWFKGACQGLGISCDKVHTNWYTDFTVDECFFRFYLNGNTIEKQKVECKRNIYLENHLTITHSRNKAVDVFFKIISRHTGVVHESEVITALCNICHFLMSENRLPIHKTRFVVTPFLRMTARKKILVCLAM